MTPEVVHALVKQLEFKDGATAAHTWRVVLYTRALAEHFALDTELIERLTIAAAVHDVGKLDVPDEVLKKPGPLDPSDWAVMRQHTLWGEARLRAAGIDDRIVLDFVRSHHERIDGSGYPDGLKGEAIARGAKYFAVIDSFDAMTSVRPYRADVGPEAAARAIDELIDESGSRYCGECVKAFAALYRTGRIGWILEHFNDRCELPPFGLGHAEAAAGRYKGTGR